MYRDMSLKTFKVPVVLVLLYGILIVGTGTLVHFLGIKSELYSTFITVLLNFAICGIIWFINKKFIGIKINFKIDFSFFKQHKITAAAIVLITLFMIVTNINHLFIALLVSLQAGIVEEVVCRGIISNYIYTHLRLKNERKQIWISAITSGTLFGLLHFINLFRQEFLPTLNQVIVAAGIGMLFAVIYLIYKNLFATIIIHFLNDFWIIISTGTATQHAQPLLSTIITTLIYITVLGILAKIIISRKIN